MGASSSHDDELRIWYSARLRRDLGEGEHGARLTPMTLVEHDAAAIKELICSNKATGSRKDSSDSVQLLMVACSAVGFLSVVGGAFIDGAARHWLLCLGASILAACGLLSVCWRRDIRRLAGRCAELELKERGYSDYGGVWACSLDNDGRIVASSKAVYRLLGEDLKVESELFLRFVAEQNVPLAMKALKDASQKGQSSCVIAMKASEKLVYLEWSFEKSQQAEMLFCAGYDVTARYELELLKQEFVQMITHDMKTPLSSIILSSQSLQDDEIDPAFVQKRARQIELRAQRLLLFINQLLDVEKLEVGAFQLELSEDDLVATMQNAIELVTPLAQAKQVSLKTELPASARIRGDHQRLVQVFVNLLSNAVKFSAPKTEVSISIEEVDENVRIAIRDCGRGIAAPDLEKIFDRFAQLRLSDGSTKGGTGLGLSIVKAIVEAHGASIKVESEVAKGSCFSFVLPALRRGDLAVESGAR